MFQKLVCHLRDRDGRNFQLGAVDQLNEKIHWTFVGQCVDGEAGVLCGKHGLDYTGIERDYIFHGRARAFPDFAHFLY